MLLEVLLGLLLWVYMSKRELQFKTGGLEDRYIDNRFSAFLFCDTCEYICSIWSAFLVLHPLCPIAVHIWNYPYILTL